MAPTLEPEIRRCDLTAIILELKCFGLDVGGLDFMDQPDSEAGKSTGYINSSAVYDL
jgi:HrpA-like RNA helicase